MKPVLKGTPTSVSRRKKLVFSILVAVLILVLGTVFRPASLKTHGKQEHEVTVSQAEIEQIQKIASKTAVSSFAGRFASAAQIVDPYLGVFLGSRVPFVAWKKGMAVSAVPLQPTPPESIGITSSGPVNVQAILDSRAFPLAAFKSDQLAEPNIAFDWMPQDGSSVILAVRGNNGQLTFTPGSFIGAEHFSCSGTQMEELRTTIPLRSHSIGSALFDTNGTLLGLAVSCRDSAAIISATDIETIIASAGSPESKLRARYGIAVSSVPQFAEKFFGAKGLLVASIWKGLPAANAGFHPGDVILSSAQQQIKNAADLFKYLSAAPGPVRVPVRRFGRVLYLRISPADNSPSHPTLGFDYSERSGLTIDNLDARSALFASGVRNGDRLLQVDGRDASPTLLERLVPGKPHYFTVQIGNRLKGVLVTP